MTRLGTEAEKDGADCGRGRALVGVGGLLTAGLMLGVAAFGGVRHGDGGSDCERFDVAVLHDGDEAAAATGIKR